MSMFSVKGNYLEGFVNQEADFIRQLQRIEDDINFIMRSFAYYGTGRIRCLRRLKAVNGEISASRKNMEMMKGALSQGIRKYRDTEKRIYENAKVNRFQYNDINKGETALEKGDETVQKDSVYSYIKAFFKYREKFCKDREAGISGALMSYIKSLQKFFNEKAKAEFFDLAKASSKLWTAYYKYLSKQDATGLLQKAWGEKAAEVSAVGSIMGLISAIYDAGEADNSTFLKRWGNAFDVLEEGTDVIKDGYEWCNYGSLISDKGKIHSTAGKYAILAKIIFSVSGQAGRSIERYSEDGSWDMNDTARTMTESSIAGLESMVSGLTFGIISTETFHTSVDDISQNLENGATSWGKQAGEYISRHKDMCDKWNNGSEFDRIGLTIEALFKMSFSK